MKLSKKSSASSVEFDLHSKELDGDWSKPNSLPERCEKITIRFSGDVCQTKTAAIKSEWESKKNSGGFGFTGH